MFRRRWSRPARPGVRRADPGRWPNAVLRRRRASSQTRCKVTDPSSFMVSASGLGRPASSLPSARYPVARSASASASSEPSSAHRSWPPSAAPSCVHRRQSALDLDPVHDPDHLAFVVQRRQCDVPAAVERAQQVFRGHLDVVEEDLAERLVGDRRHPDGFDPHPGRVQVEDQAGNAAVFRRRPDRCGHTGCTTATRGPGWSRSCDR